jgi:hypothetical protein
MEGHALTPFAPGVWLDTGPVRIVGMRLTATMTVLDLGDGNLILYSPLELTPERRAAVESLGTVAHLYAPNTYHHCWIGAWAAAFPSAKLHAPMGLVAKREDLRIDRMHGSALVSAPEPAFAGVVDELHIDGFRLEETVLVHRPTGTLVVADLVHNIGRPPGAWARFYTKMMGFYDRVALSRAIRWGAFSDHEAARRSLDELLALPFDRLVVGHGTPLDAGAHEAIVAAFAWLR